jgi:ATP-dependent DNA ligase
MMVEVYTRSRELGAILPLDGRKFKAIEVPKFWPAKQAPELWEEYIVKHGWEGLVFIKEDGSLGRCKKLVTMDYVVLDVATSDSDSYAGQARALIGGLYENGELVKKVSISGLTEFQRGDFMRRKKELIGRVFEAEGRELFKSGALRHPSFLRFRDDKMLQECVWPRG